jgi:hypothetical protein
MEDVISLKSAILRGLTSPSMFHVLTGQITTLTDKLKKWFLQIQMSITTIGTLLTMAIVISEHLLTNITTIKRLQCLPLMRPSFIPRPLLLQITRNLHITTIRESLLNGQVANTHGKVLTMMVE